MAFICHNILMFEFDAFSFFDCVKFLTQKLKFWMENNAFSAYFLS